MANEKPLGREYEVGVVLGIVLSILTCGLYNVYWNYLQFCALTGLPCPGCGMGHALLSAFQGRWHESWVAHPLGLPLLGLWTGYLAWGAINLARGLDFGAGWPALSRRSQWALVALVLVVYARRFV